MERGLETLEVFGRFCRATGIEPDDVHVVATSAIRDAANGARFLREPRAGHRPDDRGALRRGRGPLRLRRRGQHADDDRRRRARDRRREHAADPTSPTGAPRAELVPARRGPDHRAVPARAGTGARRRSSSACARTCASRSPDSPGWRGRASGWSGSAARSATSPPPPSARSVSLDIGVQGFVITREDARRPGRDARRDARRRARRRAGDQARRAATSSSPPALVLETVLELGGFDGIEVTEASLRDGVFLGRGRCSPASEPLLRRRARGSRAQPGDPVRVRHGPRRARRPVGAADVRLARRRRPVRAAAPASASCCGPPRCSTTSG